MKGPTHLQVEPTQKCNLNCMGCSVHTVYKNKKRATLSLKDIMTIFNHSPTVNDISLHGLGEPFLNNELDDIVQYLNAHKIVNRIVTNGNVYNHNIDNVKLMQNLQQLCFSIDGDNKKIYEHIRRGSNFNKFKDIVSMFSELKKDHCSIKCELAFNVTICNLNINHVTGILEIGKELGIERIDFNYMSQFYYSEKENGYSNINKIRVLDKKKLILLLKELDKESKRIGVKITYPSVDYHRRWNCFWGIHASFVTAAGLVTPCNYRMNPSTISFGNLFNQTMSEIWMSDDYKKFRNSFLTKKYYGFCMLCD